MKMVMLLFLILTASHAYADDRSIALKEKPTYVAVEKVHKTALVIGNSTYLLSPLKNPANDAKTMAKTLRELGFAVDERINLNQNDMKLAIESFGKVIKQGGVGLFFYAGHGMQVNGRNYLIPVDADIQGEPEVEIKAVDAGAVLAKMDMAKNTMNIVILDACRNNPFSRSFRAVNLGLASMNAPSGTLIAYATAPGSIASDGTGENGLYTQEVVKAIKKPGLKIEDSFKMVRTSVKQQTGDKQVPWESSSLEGDFYFSGATDTSRLDGLAEGSKERQAELERLKKLEIETAKQKEMEQAEIEKLEGELALLDAQITVMKGKLGSGAVGPDDSLENMLAMVEKKEADAQKLEELRQQRNAEIVRLKKEAATKRKTEIKKDIAAFGKIANSPYGKDMISSAWKSLTTKYALIEGIENIREGDINAIKALLLGNDEANFTKDDLVFYKDYVLDVSTNLMWTSDGNIAGKQMNWDNAMNWASNLQYGGYSDWRLPTKEELEYFTKRGRSSPSEYFNGLGFTNIQANDYWSSTIREGHPDYVWFAGFKAGNIGTSNKQHIHMYVLFVRGGQ
ncbi:MAG: hypothetical protein A2511_16990 [Deltaproteobacteria bacterium RIFOXYD12_FULL_50_9]|nr:MAG: hypothetical protein A2511_16990 [Deltaproteobacteria bacterium RIFOXYD12_FULL_50_9]